MIPRDSYLPGVDWVDEFITTILSYSFFDLSYLGFNVFKDGEEIGIHRRTRRFRIRTHGDTGFTKMIVSATTSGHAQLNYCYVLNAWVIFLLFLLYFMNAI